MFEESLWFACKESKRCQENVCMFVCLCLWLCASVLVSINDFCFQLNFTLEEV